MKDATR